MLKCIIWDLDNTLWKGVLAEQDEVTVTDDRRKLIEQIDSLGILQSIASRNDPEKALAMLQKLGLKDFFLYPQCSYQPKTVSLHKIAASLNIGLDSIGFVDDSHFELQEIRYFFPEVTTYHIPNDDQRLLQDIAQIQTAPTYEAGNRRQMMMARQNRDEAERSFQGDRKAFLKSCRMELTIRYACRNDTARICELASRSNQLNNFKQTVDDEKIKEYLSDRNRDLVVAELQDIFGYHGVIGICFTKWETPVLHMKQFCISCRIEGRGIAPFFLYETMEHFRQSRISARYVTCTYNKAARNKPALYLLKTLGFQVREDGENSCLYRADLPLKERNSSWLAIKNLL